MNANVKLKLSVQPQYFELIKLGKKKVEGRLGKEKYLRLTKGDLLLFNDELFVSVASVRHYPTFFKMLENEGLQTVLPGVESLEKGCEIYRAFYSARHENQFGVVAIELIGN